MRVLEKSHKLNIAFVEDFRSCFRFAPFGILALIAYVSLPSSSIFPDDYSLLRISWQPAFLNWCDLVLAWAIIVTCLFHRLKPDKAIVAFLYLALLAIVLSFVFTPYGAEIAPLTDAIVYWLRFALVFSFSLCLTKRLGGRAIEALLGVLFIVLCITALLVYILQFGYFNRIYASAMTVASFGQIAVIILFISITRKSYVLLVFSLCFLILTFSLTSGIIFLFMSLIYIMTSKEISARRRVISLLLVFIVITVSVYLTSNSDQYDLIYSENLNLENARTLHGRTIIWAYGIELLTSGSFGFFGVGFNRTPLLLNGISFVSDAEISFVVPHFHSILLEYILGMGIPSLGFFYLIFLRIRQTWRLKCHPASMIFIFFLLSQSLDYTFYRPKEVILWALILGFAEGQWGIFRLNSFRTSGAQTSKTSVETIEMSRISLSKFCSDH